MKLVIAITRGIIRDQHMRRQTMFAVVVSALLMLFAGATFLSGWLNLHLFWFVLYWGACGWLTITVALLAILDLLIVRAKARSERQHLRKDIFGSHDDG